MGTRREEIIEVLKEQVLSVRELAIRFDTLSEDIVEDLSHIAKSVSPDLKMSPARCVRCDYIFRGRSKIKSPSRCPECKEERIRDPRFTIVR